MKPFNLDEYLKNPSKEVVTRDGRDVRIVCTDFDNPHYPVICGIKGFKWPVSFSTSGESVKGHKLSNDLFFAPEKKEGWATIYGKFLGGEIFSTKEEAEESVKRCGTKDFVTIAKVEWEE